MSEQQVKRAKRPARYFVLKQESNGHFRQINDSPITAPSRKAAIVSAASNGEEGIFLALPEVHFKPLTRTTEMVTQDTFTA